MKTGQLHLLCGIVLAFIGSSVAINLTARAAGSVTVTETTDWAVSPMELVGVNFPTLGYSGPAFAGINTVTVDNGGGAVTYDAFCVDPFHWSAGGPAPGYFEVPLDEAPKAPGTLNASTALQIEDLWAEFFSPTMSAPSAAGLQVAIWELVSSNAVATGELSPKDAVSFNGNTYTAAADLASLATYAGQPADLTALTGPGQDYIVDIPRLNAAHPDQVPDNAATWFMLASAAGALFLGREALLKRLQPPVKRVKISVNDNGSGVQKCR